MTLDMHMLDIINKITVGLQILRELPKNVSTVWNATLRTQMNVVNTCC